MIQSERKKIFFDTLTPFFRDLGYKSYLTDDDPGYVYASGEIVKHFFFNFFSTNIIGCTPLLLSNYEIENHILLVGIPTNSLIEHKKKLKYHLPTIELRSKPSDLRRRPLDTKDDIKAFAEAYIRFYENEGKLFYSENESVLDIFNNLTKLESQGEQWKSLISGMGDAFIRVLIISKLCDDPEYTKKFDKIDSMIQNAAEWLPYWEKYKEVLASIKPRYNREV